jgi:hypothetical protein
MNEGIPCEYSREDREDEHGIDEDGERPVDIVWQTAWSEGVCDGGDCLWSEGHGVCDGVVAAVDAVLRPAVVKSTPSIEGQVVRVMQRMHVSSDDGHHPGSCTHSSTPKLGRQPGSWNQSASSCWTRLHERMNGLFRATRVPKRAFDDHPPPHGPPSMQSTDVPLACNGGVPHGVGSQVLEKSES